MSHINMCLCSLYSGMYNALTTATCQKIRKRGIERNQYKWRRLYIVTVTIFKDYLIVTVTIFSCSICPHVGRSVCRSVRQQRVLRCVPNLLNVINGPGKFIEVQYSRSWPLQQLSLIFSCNKGRLKINFAQRLLHSIDYCITNKQYAKKDS